MAGARRKGKKKGGRATTAFKEKTYEKETLQLDEKPISAVEALQVVADLVRARAGEIASGLIEAAQQGELGHAKYLYELAGIHPPIIEATESKPEESPTYTWLKELASTAGGRDQGAARKDVGSEEIL